MVPPLLRGCIPQSSAFYQEVRTVPEVVKDVFKEYSQGKDHMSPSDFRNFVENFQGGSITEGEAQSLIVQTKEGPHRPHHQHQSSHGSRHGGGAQSTLSLADFIKFLLRPDANSATKPKSLTHDMTAPMSAYFVFTSHNTYLTGNQLWSRCSTTPIIQALRAGCRVVELDTWEKRGKLKVLHGGTLTKAVGFEECVKAIKEHAFVASPYPVIITIENHLKPEFQVEAAKVLKRVLGDTLFIPNREHQKPTRFLSPEELKGKIIISDKPFRQPLQQQVDADPEGAEEILGTGPSSPKLNPTRKVNPGGVKIPLDKVQKGAAKLDDKTASAFEELPKADEFDALLYIYCEKPSEMEEKHVKGEPLVPGRYANMANLSEPQLKNLIKTHPGSIIEYTQNNLGRLYPFGLRFDSSNADPMIGWSHGCQLSAINFQGKDRAVWLSKAFFKGNGACGYVKKPEAMLPGSSISYQELLELPPKLLLKVKILVGTQWHKVFDLVKKPDFYVLVAVKGIPTDVLRKKTKIAENTKEPNWEENEFEFPLRVPELAVLRLEVWENDRFQKDDFVGQCCIPVAELRRGIRVVSLQSKKGKERSSKLLCQFKLDDIETGLENVTTEQEGGHVHPETQNGNEV